MSKMSDQARELERLIWHAWALVYWNRDLMRAIYKSRAGDHKALALPEYFEKGNVRSLGRPVSVRTGQAIDGLRRRIGSFMAAVPALREAVHAAGFEACWTDPPATPPDTDPREKQ